MSRSDTASVIGVIQGRMGSTRLPGKLLAPIAGRPLLRLLVERVRAAAVDEWWFATSDRPEDEVAAAWGAALGVRVLRGDGDDVLSRFAAIVEMRDPAWIVRLTADNPFTDAHAIDALLESARGAPPAVDQVGEGAERTLPLGYLPEAVRGAALRRLATQKLAAHHRAHVTSALREDGRSIEWRAPGHWPPRPDWRWTVDTADDLAMADAAFTLFGRSATSIGYRAMVRVLDERPEITRRNAGGAQRAVAEG